MPVVGDSFVVVVGASDGCWDSVTVGALFDVSSGEVGSKVPVDGVARGNDRFESGDAKFVAIFFFIWVNIGACGCVQERARQSSTL